jgi:hypothetical protein
MSPFWKLFLLTSLLVNAWLGYRYLQRADADPSAAAPKTPAEIKINTDGFDFSGTGLSDEAWKVPQPDVSAPAAEIEPDPLKELDKLQLLPKPNAAQ